MGKVVQYYILNFPARREGPDQYFDFDVKIMHCHPIGSDTLTGFHIQNCKINANSMDQIMLKIL